MTDEQVEVAGHEIAKLFNLKLNKKEQYETNWGPKTAIGLARCVFRIIEESAQTTLNYE